MHKNGRNLQRKNGYTSKLIKNQNENTKTSQNHRILDPEVIGHHKKQATLIVAYTKK